MRIPVKYLAQSFAVLVGIDPATGTAAPTFEEDGYVELIVPKTHIWMIDNQIIEEACVVEYDNRSTLTMVTNEDDEEYAFFMDDDMDFRRIQVYEKCGLKEKTALLNKFKDQV